MQIKRLPARKKNQLANINIERRNLGLPMLRTCVRKCLRCGQVFETYGNTYMCCKEGVRYGN